MSKIIRSFLLGPFLLIILSDFQTRLRFFCANEYLKLHFIRLVFTLLKFEGETQFLLISVEMISENEKRRYENLRKSFVLAYFYIIVCNKPIQQKQYLSNNRIQFVDYNTHVQLITWAFSFSSFARLTYQPQSILSLEHHLLFQHPIINSPYQN